MWREKDRREDTAEIFDVGIHAGGSGVEYVDFKYSDGLDVVADCVGGVGWWKA